MMMICPGLFVTIAGIIGFVVFILFGVKLKNGWQKEREIMKEKLECEINDTASHRYATSKRVDKKTIAGTTETCVNNGMIAKNCSKCGAVLSTDALFCENCGTRVG